MILNEPSFQNFLYSQKLEVLHELVTFAWLCTDQARSNSLKNGMEWSILKYLVACTEFHWRMLCSDVN